jgi:hypothetical protein
MALKYERAYKEARRTRAGKPDCDQVLALGSTSRERILFAQPPFPQIPGPIACRRVPSGHETFAPSGGRSHVPGEVVKSTKLAAALGAGCFGSRISKAKRRYVDQGTLAEVSG